MSLTKTHSDIADCIICNSFADLGKNPNLERGSESSLMVLGIAPGSTEITNNRAFSGPAGKKLIQWLINASIGKDEEEVRKNTYFTSLLKCYLTNQYDLNKMFRNCSKFLTQQLNIIKPNILITLGSQVFNKLFSSDYILEKIVGQHYLISDLILPDMFPDELPLNNVNIIIPFPHPSGISRWLNDKENKVKLEKAIEILSTKYRELAK